MSTELPFDDIRAMTMSTPVRFNDDTPEGAFTVTTHDTPMFSMGQMVLPGDPLCAGPIEPRGKIDALVTMLGRPVPRPVWLMTQEGVMVGKTMSDDGGRYMFEGLDKKRRYIVLALDDPERNYNAAISDYVQPE